jgi:signal transduction histidine kinase
VEGERLYERYRELQQYVDWTDADIDRITSAFATVKARLPGLIDDFYQEIERHPNARQVITGGDEQVQRLKQTLLRWLEDLFSGNYGPDFVARRWKIAWRHVEIGLDQVYPNVALTRLRKGLIRSLVENWSGDADQLTATVESLNTLIELDLAIIQDAYQAEHVDRLQRTERMAAIGQVSGGVAHELRNPLNAVKTSVYYLRNAKQPSPEKVEEHLERIDRQVTMADAVITTLSSFAKMPVPARKELVLAEIVDRVLKDVSLPGSIEVETQISDDLPKVLADGEQLQIVFRNLVRNARDAMPDGGRLVVKARNDEDRVEVDVTDTGIGIAKEHLARILEPLYSTKARGIGLGLAITRSILDKNGGALLVQSEQGKGSTFTVRLEAVGSKGN